jgi:hypothetical protein
MNYHRGRSGISDQSYQKNKLQESLKDHELALFRLERSNVQTEVDQK